MLMRSRKVTWDTVRNLFPAESTDAPQGSPFGAGLGFIGNEGFSFIIVHALGRGIHIKKKLQPFRKIYKPILIPWQDIARMTLRWTPTWSGKKNDIQTELQLQNSSLPIITIPWDKALLNAVPDNTIVDKQNVDT